MTGTAVEQALAPLEAELLRRAGEQAARTTARARDEAASVMAAARREAEAVLAEAGAQGLAEHAAYAATVRADVGRRRRRVVLAAQCEMLEEFRRRAREEAKDLRHAPCYPALLRHLSETVRRRGGDDLVIDEHPDGGVVAHGPGRRLDATLPALADRMIDTLAGEVQCLWLS
ncbi:hypothetical protein OG884_16840 [Streptosporangium sp. NBC_01755]|uniref:hypothetical protein n=1 Tax=unclassified Streptosporangium TaxID=2632669 RepID=UPI002DD9ECD5|nr:MULTISPECIES: hypothetical protein [unclassified Streptosporangium]WSA25175.1 hypothetical protein OIE13_30275 [Streptosporangium sp. NBC_01810]WSD03485.1 hypothetical protein OG884_16840 [Streptosporangium sp. NBC_01755]